jgi:hypothetical protein
VTLVSLLLLGLVFFMLNGYRQKNRANALLRSQNREIEQKKTIIEEKQKEILDSIQYARRIQRSLLPGENYIQKELFRLNKNTKRN